jgi:hypothetical protein
MVVLAKLCRQIQRLELVRPENFGKEAALILEHLRRQHANITQLSRFNTYFDDSSLSQTAVVTDCNENLAAP